MLQAVVTLDVGATFGESIVHDLPRDMTVCTKTTCELLRIHQNDFKKIWDVSNINVNVLKSCEIIPQNMIFAETWYLFPHFYFYFFMYSVRETINWDSTIISIILGYLHGSLDQLNCNFQTSRLELLYSILELREKLIWIRSTAENKLMFLYTTSYFRIFDKRIYVEIKIMKPNKIFPKIS